MASQIRSILSRQNRQQLIAVLLCHIVVPELEKKKFQVLLVEMVNFLGIGVGLGGKSPQGEERKGGRKEEGTIQSDWNGPPLNS